MTPYLLSFVSLACWIAFAIPTLIVLLRLFARTQMRSFLWLIGALFAWPLLARGLSLFMPFLFSTLGRSTSLFGVRYLSAYSLVFLVETLVGGALLLTAIVLLDRDLTARTLPPTPPPSL